MSASATRLAVSTGTVAIARSERARAITAGAASDGAGKRIRPPSVLEDGLLEEGGAEGTRTPDPHTASVVRYQLRHSPEPTRSGASGPGMTVQG